MQGIISKPLGTITVKSGTVPNVKFPNIAIARVSEDDGDGNRFISDTKTTALVRFFSQIVYNLDVPPGTTADMIKADVEWEAYE